MQETKETIYISNSSLDNLEFVLISELKRNQFCSTAQAKRLSKLAIQDLLLKVELAKTPSYLEIDYDDIEDSLVVASARSVDAKVLTRDKGMLERYPNDAISPLDYLNETKKASVIKFLDLKAINQPYHSAFEKAFDDVLNSGWYIQGQQVKLFEQEFADYCGV